MNQKISSSNLLALAFAAASGVVLYLLYRGRNNGSECSQDARGASRGNIVSDIPSPGEDMYDVGRKNSRALEEHIAVVSQLAPDRLQLKIMTFNLWYGGAQVNIHDTAAAIISSEADIVGIQEADANLHVLADLAGLPYVDERRSIISRFPIFDSGDGYQKNYEDNEYSTCGLDYEHVHAWILVSPGKLIAFVNTHLSSDPYGPDEVMKGHSLQHVLEIEENVRGDDMRALAKAISPIAKGDLPIFVTGDFNCPSHLDWTTETIGLRPHMKYAVRWPVSVAMEAAGLRDTYREVHPDPINDPGITFTPGQPRPHPVIEENLDRIDFIFTAGKVEVCTCEVYDHLLLMPWQSNQQRSYNYPWPSDHSSVVCTVNVVPIDAFPLISVTRRRVVRGTDISIRVLMKKGDSWSVVIVPKGGGFDAAIVGILNEKYNFRRNMRFSSTKFVDGEYDAILLSGDHFVELKRVRFAVVSAHVVSEIEVLSADNETLTIGWNNAPGNRYDWVAIFRKDDINLSGYLGHFYTGGSFSGSARVSLLNRKIFEHGPLTAGAYDAVLLRNDELVELARATFVVE